MRFALFSLGSFDTLVQRIAQRIVVRCPPVVANNPEPTVPQERIEEILSDTIGSVLRSYREERTGFIGRMRLKSDLRWELREIGYEEKFADLAARKLLELLTAATD